MKIGVIGTGRMGGALGQRWAAAGHQVMFGSREAHKGAALAAHIPGASAGSYAEAAAFGEVVVLATPWAVAQEVLAGLPLAGKTLMEITNNLSGVGYETGTSEQIAKWAPGARVVKAFNTIFSQLVVSAPGPEQPTVFVAGDDAEAKRLVAALVSDAGFAPLDVGGIDQSRMLDALARFIIHLGYNRGMGPHTSYRIIGA